MWHVFKRSARKITTATFAVAFLSGCASSSIVTDGNWPRDRRVVEGFDIGESSRVLNHGLKQIEARALTQPLIGRFVLTGLQGLSDIEPLLTLVDTGDRVQTYVGPELTSDLPRPPNSNVEAWVSLFQGTVVGIRRKSALMRRADLEEIYYAFFDTALEDLDPYSRYAGRLQARANRETRNGFGGVGMRYVEEDLGIRVTGLQKNAPAYRGGVRLGDVITHIDGNSAALKRRWTVRRMLRGPIGTKTSLTIIREKLGQAARTNITRSLIVPQTVETSVKDNIAIVKIHSFNQQTAQTVNAELSQVLTSGTQVDGVILDLRGDPGGLLDQAVTVTDLFLETGRIVSTRGRHPESIQRYQAFEGDVTQGLPIVVMVDSRSASAAEIVAAAIQDSGRGLILGTSSYGKGTVQTVIRLPNDGEITLTWSRFHTPDGYAIQDLGVLPFVCTSGIEGSVDEALDDWRLSASQIADIKAQWRTVAPEDIQTRSKLRSRCPAEIRPDTSIDLDLAQNLVSNPILYAQALGLTATTEAQSGQE